MNNTTTNESSSHTDQNSAQEPGSVFLSLAQAAKLTGYHQDYLGQLARKGKLESKKIGRNWVTTRQAINRFLGREQAQEQAQKNNQSEVSVSAIQTTAPAPQDKPVAVTAAPQPEPVAVQSKPTPATITQASAIQNQEDKPTAVTAQPATINSSAVKPQAASPDAGVNVQEQLNNFSMTQWSGKVLQKDFVARVERGLQEQLVRLERERTEVQTLRSEIKNLKEEYLLSLEKSVDQRIKNLEQRYSQALSKISAGQNIPRSNPQPNPMPAQPQQPSRPAILGSRPNLVQRAQPQPASAIKPVPAVQATMRPQQPQPAAQSRLTNPTTKPIPTPNVPHTVKPVVAQQAVAKPVMTRPVPDVVKRQPGDIQARGKSRLSWPKFNFNKKVTVATTLGILMIVGLGATVYNWDVNSIKFSNTMTFTDPQFEKRVAGDSTARVYHWPPVVATSNQRQPAAAD